MGKGRVTHAGAGIAGVRVSDGLHVTATGADGDYELPGDRVFVVRPTGFTCAAWHGGPDFALQAADQPVPFTFTQVTDLHLSLGDTAYGAGRGDATIWLDADGLHDRVVTTPAVLAELFAEIDADFVVATGDLVNDGQVAELAAYASVVADAPVPVVSIPGNHDHHQAAPPAFPYEDALGPRWFSFDHGGVHFVAIDWYTWRLRLDHEQQEAWLQADLALNALPVVLLSHDQMPSDFFDRLPVRPVATFSGHWHTTRVVADKGTTHYNTGTATFGGLDYSPAHYRLATWDGTALSVRTVTRGPAALSGATMRASAVDGGGHRWAAQLPGGAHLAGPVVADEHVLCVTRSEDAPGGSLVCLSSKAGTTAWTASFSAAVKAQPLVVAGSAVAVSVSGEVVRVDLGTGEELWRVQVDDPLRPWVHLRPATDGTRVFVGDVGRFAALDLAIGAEVWARTDLGQRENLTSFSHPVVVGDRLLVGFAGQTPALWALDPATGATLWPAADRGASIYQGGDLATDLPRVVVSGLTPAGDDVLLVRLGSALERIACATGDLVWSAELTGWFNPAAPVLWDDAVLATEGMGRVHCVDAATGALRWVTPVGGDAPLALGSYRADGPASLAAPTVVGDRALVPCGDGTLVALSRSGDVLAELHTGVPVTGSLVVTDDDVLALGVDGVLRAYPRHLLLG